MLPPSKPAKNCVCICYEKWLPEIIFACVSSGIFLYFLELFAMGPLQFSWPRGVPENWFTKPGFWEHFVSFSQEKQQNTEFTKFSSVRTPEIYQIWFFGIGPDPAGSDIFLLFFGKPGLREKFVFNSRPLYLCHSKCLLKSPFLESQLLRSPLRSLPPSKSLCKTPSKNPSSYNLLHSSLENFLFLNLRQEESPYWGNLSLLRQRMPSQECQKSHPS